MLAKQKRITRGIANLYRVLDADGPNASLAGNILCHEIHPADQLVTFDDLYRDGIGFEDIAVRPSMSAPNRAAAAASSLFSPALMQAAGTTD